MTIGTLANDERTLLYIWYSGESSADAMSVSFQPTAAGVLVYQFFGEM